VHAPGPISPCNEIFYQPRLPARLDVVQTSKLLGFTDRDVAVLVKAKLLCPLGKPAPNAPKYFAAVEILSRANNTEWLGKATTAIAKHWRSNNLKKIAGTTTHVSPLQPIT